MLIQANNHVQTQEYKYQYKDMTTSYGMYHMVKWFSTARLKVCKVWHVQISLECEKGLESDNGQTERMWLTNKVGLEEVAR